MSYLARLSTDEANALRILDALAEIFDTKDTATAVVQDKAGSWAVELFFAHEPDTAWLRSVVAEAVGEATAGTLTLSALAPRDWVKASLAGLRPVVAGRFVVHGRHDRAAITVNHIAIEIEAALAFGTGHHGTTRGCLLALDAMVKQRRASGRRTRFAGPRSTSILDIGTGSGVLAIAAAKALRRRVLGSDIDAVAVRAARDNARLNRSAPLIEVVRAAGLTAPRIRARAPYDIVLANILLGPVRLLARPIARVLGPGGRVIVSGLLSHQAHAAIAVYRAQGLVLERRIALDDWVTLVFRRRTGPCSGR